MRARMETSVLQQAFWRIAGKSASGRMAAGGREKAAGLPCMTGSFICMRRRPCARLAAGEDRSGRQETLIFRKSILAAAVVAAIVMPAAAQQSEVLFQHKRWRVELVAWDDGVLGCQATVGTDSESFSLW